jgi:hypothetical protein
MERMIENLKNIIQDEALFKKMNKSCVIAFLGELLVYQKLKNERNIEEVEHYGNQAGYDLRIKFKRDYTCCVDVKTSTFNAKTKCWDWSLRNNCDFCSHFICVALDLNLDAQHYYVLPKSNRLNFPDLPTEESDLTKYLRVSDRNDETNEHVLESKKAIEAGFALKITNDGSLSNAIAGFR